MKYTADTLLDMAIKTAEESGERRRHGAVIVVDGKIITGYNQMYCLLRPEIS